MPRSSGQIRSGLASTMIERLTVAVASGRGIIGSTCIAISGMASTAMQ